MKAAFKSLVPLLAFIAALVFSASGQSPVDACLDKNINKTDLSYRGSKIITVDQNLVKLNARCRNGKLVDARRRGIKFFKHECWGNPPADYAQIQQRQRSELSRLKRKYTVIEIACAVTPASPH